MPRLKDLQCTVEYGQENAPLHEYGTTYEDGLVETYVAVPTRSVPFSIHLTSLDYIAPGLAMFVYIDAVPQCNRNRRGLVPPDKATKNDVTKVDFRVRQKEEKVDEGRWIGREWTFAELNTTTADSNPEVDEDILQNLGTIEVVVLRCYDEPNIAKTRTKTGGNNKIANLDGANDSDGESWHATDFALGYDGNNSPTNKYDARYRGSCYASEWVDGPPPSPLLATSPNVSNGDRATPVILNQYFANPPLMYSQSNSHDALHGLGDAFARHGFTGPNISPQQARSSSRVHWPDQTYNQIPAWQSGNTPHMQPGYMGAPPGYPFNVPAPQQWPGHQRHNSGGAYPLPPEVHARIKKSLYGEDSDKAESVQMNHTAWPSGHGPMPPNWPPQGAMPPGYPWWLGYPPGAYGNWTTTPHNPSHSQTQPKASGVTEIGTGVWNPSGEKQKKKSGPQNSPNASSHSSQNDDKRWGNTDTANNDSWKNDEKSGDANAWSNNNDNATTPWGDSAGNNNNDATAVGGWDSSGNAGNSGDWGDNKANETDTWGQGNTDTTKQDSNSWNATPAQDTTWTTNNADDWTTPAADNNNNNKQNRSNSSHKRASPKKKREKSSNSNNHGSPTASSGRSKKPIDPSRPFIKPYWTPNDTEQRHALSNPSLLDANNCTSNPASSVYITPTLPLHAVPSSLASEQQKTHQVRAGPGAVYYHRAGRPAYIDTLENPYAVFVFKYRSSEILRKILPDEEIREEKGKGGQYKKKMMGLSKEEIFAELMRAKKNAGYGTDSSLEESSEGGSEDGSKKSGKSEKPTEAKNGKGESTKDKGKEKEKKKNAEPAWDSGGGGNQPASGW